jgi:hypothetical protein
MRTFLTSPSALSYPAYAAPIKTHDLDDDFPEGNYEIFLEEQTFRLIKRKGQYIPALGFP